MFKRYIPLVLLLAAQNLAIDAKSLYATLGLKGLYGTATAKEIASACLRARGKYHPDRNAHVIMQEYLDVNNACDVLQGRSHISTWYKSEEEFIREELGNLDSCIRPSQLCTCSSSLKRGTCQHGPSHTGLYCQCPEVEEVKQQQQEEPKQNAEDDFFSSSRKPEPHTVKDPVEDPLDYEEYLNQFEEFVNNADRAGYRSQELRRANYCVLSRSIDSPIYNFALHQALIPDGRKDQDFQFINSNAFFVQNDAFGDFFTKQEIGVVSRSLLGYGAWHLDIFTLFSALSTNFTHEHGYENIVRTAFRDCLIALGYTQQLGYLKATLRGLVGTSFHHLHKDDFMFRTTGPSSPLIDLPHLNCGIELYTLTPIAQTPLSNHDFVANARWLHFVSNKATIEIKSGSSDRYRTGSDIEFETRPGSFLDILIGIDNKFGTDQQHHLALGYNPTFNLAFDRLETHTHSINHLNAEITLHHLQQPEVQHRLYGYYRFDFLFRELPGSLSIGYSKAFTSESHPHAFRPGAGLFWMSFTLAL